MNSSFSPCIWKILIHHPQTQLLFFFFHYFTREKADSKKKLIIIINQKTTSQDIYIYISSNHVIWLKLVNNFQRVCDFNIINKVVTFRMNQQTASRPKIISGPVFIPSCHQPPHPYIYINIFLCWNIVL